MVRNVAQLEAFYWLFKLRSFHATARHLNITQPTISARIKELESHLGSSLFQRSTRSVRPTAKAEAIFDNVERILLLLDDTSNIVRTGDALSGHVRLGLTDSFAVSLLPTLQERLRRDYPGLRTEITVETSHVLFGQITTGALDTAVLCHWHDHDEVSAEFLGYQEIAWFTRVALDFDRPLTPKDLVGMPIYANPAPSINYATTVNWFAAPDLAPQALNTCSSVSVIVQLVTSGQGVAILPKCLADAQVRAGKAVLLQTEPQLEPQPIYVIQRKRGTNRAAKAVSGLIRSIVEESQWLLKETRPALGRAEAGLPSHG